VEAFARDLGYSLAELAGAEMKTARAPAPAKYRHPENAALTWPGRGRTGWWQIGNRSFDRPSALEHLKRP
jgi:DNA-binding protein H-NS